MSHLRALRVSHNDRALGVSFALLALGVFCLDKGVVAGVGDGVVVAVRDGSRYAHIDEFVGCVG